MKDIDESCDGFPPADQAVLEELWRRKNANNVYPPVPHVEWMGVAVAELDKDVTMRVWNGTHPPDKNTTEHTATKGTTVLIWMMSRFGDIGVTDNLDAHCYHARVEPTALVNWRFK